MLSRKFRVHVRDDHESGRSVLLESRASFGGVNQVGFPRRVPRACQASTKPVVFELHPKPRFL